MGSWIKIIISEIIYILISISLENLYAILSLFLSIWLSKEGNFILLKYINTFLLFPTQTFSWFKAYKRIKFSETTLQHFFET